MKKELLLPAFLILFALAPATARSAPAPGPNHFLFAYFTGNGEDGLHLAWSRDGQRWEPVNRGRTVLFPLVGESALMRDPCITVGPDGAYHMVWTTSWNGKTIGYANSRDLRHWSRQQAIPVMASEPGAQNCWAPEILYLPERGEFILYWSTTIPGRFPETAGSTRAGDTRNHRFYYTLTRDFRSFAPSRLLYDPGFNAIDASIYRLGARYVMFLKDETELPRAQKNLRIAYADSATGPWGPSSAPITGGYWAEGPTAVRIGEEWHLYFDKYRDRAYGLLASRDLRTWEDRSARLQLPEGLRHGTVLAVSREALAPLLALDEPPAMLYRDESRKGRPYAKDPAVVKFHGRYYLYYSLPPKEEAGKPSGGWSIGIAVSEDLERWKKAGEIAPEQSYEARGLCAPAAEAIGGKVHLFYQTYGNREKDAICHAWSEDGIRFVRNPTNPVFAPTGDWNCGRAIDADLEVDGDSAYLYWATRDPAYGKQFLGVAVAPLAGNFVRDSWKQISREPLLQPELPWELSCIEAPAVFRQQGAWWMFYAGAYNHEGQQIGLARSRDGIAWERCRRQPVLPKGGENQWNAAESGHPAVFRDDDGTLWLFYQGNPDGGATYYLSRVRVGWKDNLPEPLVQSNERR